MTHFPFWMNHEHQFRGALIKQSKRRKQMRILRSLWNLKKWLEVEVWHFWVKSSSVTSVVLQRTLVGPFVRRFGLIREQTGQKCSCKTKIGGRRMLWISVESCTEWAAKVIFCSENSFTIEKMWQTFIKKPIENGVSFCFRKQETFKGHFLTLWKHFRFKCAQFQAVKIKKVWSENFVGTISGKCCFVQTTISWGETISWVKRLESFCQCRGMSLSWPVYRFLRKNISGWFAVLWVWTSTGLYVDWSWSVPGGYLERKMEQKIVTSETRYSVPESKSFFEVD